MKIRKQTAIAVLDRGFVYVGQCSIKDDTLTIQEARNIRYWGTSKGLGELINGPLAQTKVDDVGTVMAPIKSIIHIIPCKSGW